MSHDLAINSEGRASFAFVGPQAWHGLGTQISATDTMEQIATKGGLDFTAKLANVQYTTEDGTQQTVGNQSIIYRSGNLRHIGQCSPSRYKLVQPIEILEFFSDFLSDNGLSIETLGAVKGGRIIWSLAKLGPDYDFLMPGGDRATSYVRLQTSYDGSHSTELAATTIRVVCRNTLDYCNQETKGRNYRTPHCRQFDAVALQKAFGFLGEDHRLTAAVWNELVKRRVTEREAHDFFCSVLDIDQTKLSLSQKDGGISTRKQNMLAALADSYTNGPGARMPSSYGTAFGLLNAVTHYVDHKSSFQDPFKDGSGRINKIWYGEGAKTKQDALLALAELADVSSLIKVSH